MKDQLFLMQPDFTIGDRGPFYCGDSVSVEGLLSFYPVLREKVDVHYIAHPRPRAELVALIGSEHQAIPALILAAAASAQGMAIEAKTALGHAFLDNEADIRRYLSGRYGVALAS